MRDAAFNKANQLNRAPPIILSAKERREAAFNKANELNKSPGILTK